MRSASFEERAPTATGAVKARATSSAIRLLLLLLIHKPWSLLP
jgi:hypothetical protein